MRGQAINRVEDDTTDNGADNTTDSWTDTGTAARGVISWSSFLFALLQSVCTFLAAFDGLRLTIGVGAFVASAGFTAILDKWHLGWTHLPMLLLAVCGSVLNLVVLWQIKRLRARPAARWRVSKPSAHKIQMERLQLVLSIGTLVLVGMEESLHHHWVHRF